jgi:mannose-6-phosphate isomerase
MPSDLHLDILGISFSITADEDPAYLEHLLDIYRKTTGDIAESTGLKDSLKIAILTGFLLCDELEKLKKDRDLGNEEEQETLKRTLNLLSRLDEAMGGLPARENGDTDGAAAPATVPAAPLYKLQNMIKHYEWGSPVHIPALLGVDNSLGLPWAELWMGVHPGGPSRIDGKEARLGDLIAGDPEQYLGKPVADSFGGLPFLFKLLAAAKPLSIQAHPNLEQAREGWQRENEAGIAPDAPNRNYKDDYHKPEILCALNPFTAMCGFRQPEEIDSLLAKHFASAPPSLLNGINFLRAALQEEVPLRSFLQALFSLPPAIWLELTGYIQESSMPGGEWDLASRFAALYPGDPGILAPIYLNLLQLAPGEAVYLPAGVLHAYVHGFAVELMANSDNVLRGGLSSKHVDVDELLSILNFHPYCPEILRARPVGDGISRYHTPCREFSLQVMKGQGGTVLFPEKGPAIIIVTEGKLRVSPENTENPGGGDLILAKGESAFIPALKGTGSGALAFSGIYTLYAAVLPSTDNN